MITRMVRRVGSILLLGVAILADSNHDLTQRDRTAAIGSNEFPSIIPKPSSEHNQNRHLGSEEMV